LEVGLPDKPEFFSTIEEKVWPLVILPVLPARFFLGLGGSILQAVNNHEAKKAQN
jgi:hypothetical protein